MNIKITTLIAAAFTTLCVNAHAARNTVEQPQLNAIELTPIFDGVEKDCAVDSPNFQTFMHEVVSPDGKSPALSSLQKELQVAIGNKKITVKDHGEYRTITLPLTGATYRGFEVRSIDRWVGKDNGYSGLSIKFNAPLGAVQKAFGVLQRPEEETEQTKPELFAGGKPAHAILSCDFSN